MALELVECPECNPQNLPLCLKKYHRHFFEWGSGDYSPCGFYYPVGDNSWCEDVEGLVNNIFGLGCSRPASCVENLFNAMEYCVFLHSDDPYKTKIADRMVYERFKGCKGLLEMSIVYLDAKDLIDYGVSLKFPWLTKKGEDIYECVKIFVETDIG